MNKNNSNYLTIHKQTFQDVQNPTPTYIIRFWRPLACARELKGELQIKAHHIGELYRLLKDILENPTNDLHNNSN